MVFPARRWHELFRHVESELHHVAILHDVVFALNAQLGVFLGFMQRTARHEILVRHNLSCNEASLKICALAPAGMVQARVSFGPVVR